MQNNNDQESQGYQDQLNDGQTSNLREQPKPVVNSVPTRKNNQPQNITGFSVPNTIQTKIKVYTIFHKNYKESDENIDESLKQCKELEFNVNKKLKFVISAIIDNIDVNTSKKAIVTNVMFDNKDPQIILVSKDNINKDDMKEKLEKRIFEYKQDVESITITVNLVDE